MINSPNFVSFPYLTGYAGAGGNAGGVTQTALSVPFSPYNNANLFDNQYGGSGLNSSGGMGGMVSQLLNTFLSMITEMFNTMGQGNPAGQFGASPYPSPMDNSGSGMPMNDGSFPMAPGYGNPSGGMGPYGSALMDSSGYGMPPGYGMPTNGGYPPNMMFPQDSGAGQYYMPPQGMGYPPAQDANSGQTCPYSQPPAQDTTPNPGGYYPQQPVQQDTTPHPRHHHPPRGGNHNVTYNNVNIYNPPPVQQDTVPSPATSYPPPVQQDTTPYCPPAPSPAPVYQPPVQQDTNPSPAAYPPPPVHNNLTVNNIYVYNQGQPQQDTTPTPMPDDCYCPTPAPIQQDTTPTPPPPPPPPAYNDNGNGSYRGDPHFVGFGGEKYDVMGQPGKTYNILSDKGLQYNTTFDHLPGSPDGTTTIVKAGITSGKDHLELDLHGTPQLNGQAMEVNKQYTLDNSGQAKWDGKNLNFSNSEYSISLGDDALGDKNALSSDVKVKDGVNPLADGVAPHGILGQTADGVAGEHKGVNNQNVKNQGGTVIDGTFDQYEVNDLFDTSFKNFNRFSGAKVTA